MRHLAHPYLLSPFAVVMAGLIVVAGSSVWGLAQDTTTETERSESAAKSATAGDAGGSPRLSDAEIAVMAGDIAADAVFGEGDAFGLKIRESLTLEPVAKNGHRAAHTNVRYGDHPRNVFDLWSAQSTTENAAPLVVFIHGGGFRRGDKSLLYDSPTLVRLLEAGVSVAGINYRFSHQSPEGSLGSLRDAARFVQFIRHHAEQYQIDPKRIACYGGSAGGAASLWLAYRDDMADPASPDPIARQSTRMTCVGAMATPSTLDILKWKEILGISHEQVIAAAKSFGTRDEAELYRPETVHLRSETDLIRFMSADDPPVFIHNNDVGSVPTKVAHMAHHPNHARVLKQRADELGVEAVVLAPQIGLNDPSGEDLVAFLLRHLRP